jgi:hypothetical protein
LLESKADRTKRGEHIISPRQPQRLQALALLVGSQSLQSRLYNLGNVKSRVRATRVCGTPYDRNMNMLRRLIQAARHGFHHSLKAHITDPQCKSKNHCHYYDWKY